MMVPVAPLPIPAVLTKEIVIITMSALETFAVAIIIVLDVIMAVEDVCVKNGDVAASGSQVVKVVSGISKMVSFCRFPIKTL